MDCGENTVFYGCSSLVPSLHFQLLFAFFYYMRKKVGSGDWDCKARHLCSLTLSLSDKWSPALQIRTVLLSIQALLSAPNPDDPLANDVADEWKKNESKAIETGKE